MDAPRPPPKRTLAVLLALAAAAYLPVLRGGFAYDDIAILRKPASLHAPTWSLSVSGRPVTHLTFRADRALWGEHPAGWHLTSLLLHLAAVALVSAQFGGAAGLLFGLHPLASSATCYVAERSEVLVALSTLGCLNCLLRKRWSAAALCWLLGLLSKETAVAVPLCALALMGRPVLRWALACTAAAGVAGLAILHDLHLPAERPPWDLYALTELRVVWRSLGLWALPLHQALDADIALSAGWLSPATTALAALALPLLFLWGGWRPALAALLALAPSSSVVPLLDPFQEHRMYLPCAFLAAGVGPLLEKGLGRRGLLLVPLGLLLTFGRASLWTSDAAMWQSNLRVAPRKLRVHANLANRYRDRGLWDASDRVVRRAIRIRERPEMWRDLAKTAFLRGDLRSEAERLRRAIAGFRAAGRAGEAAPLEAELARLEALR